MYWKLYVSFPIYNAYSMGDVFAFLILALGVVSNVQLNPKSVHSLQRIYSWGRENHICLDENQSILCNQIHWHWEIREQTPLLYTESHHSSSKKI